MPLDLTTLTLVAKPVTLEEGLEILERDNYVCQYCGLDGRADFENALNMSVDFVVPRARKGKKDPRNLVACCRSCNMIKGTRIYRSFDEAKGYVLARREELRKAWQAKSTQPRSTTRVSPSAAAASKSAPASGASKAAAADSAKGSKSKSGSVISSSPLSLRKH
jgi:hypothetical protein